MSGGIAVTALGIFALLHTHVFPEAPPMSHSEAASTSVDAELVAVIEAAVQAQARFDPKALADVLTPDYVEVSPVGEVDRREAVLGFYDPANRRPAPVVTVTEPVMHRDGSTGIVIVRLAFSPSDQATPRPPMLMRASYVMRRVSAKWMIASAQFTPIRMAGR
ncbi:nuclear transport factor 2 family protein [Sphingomonas sp. 2R-10]|nr:nuclear transport factor 2 family protein [Sphingomonas sp. 2R-10]